MNVKQHEDERQAKQPTSGSPNFNLNNSESSCSLPLNPFLLDEKEEKEKEKEKKEKEREKEKEKEKRFLLREAIKKKINLRNHLRKKQLKDERDNFYKDFFNNLYNELVKRQIKEIASPEDTMINRLTFEIKRDAMEYEKNIKSIFFSLKEKRTNLENNLKIQTDVINSRIDAGKSSRIDTMKAMEEIEGMKAETLKRNLEINLELNLEFEARTAEISEINLALETSVDENILKTLNIFRGEMNLVSLIYNLEMAAIDKVIFLRKDFKIQKAKRAFLAKKEIDEINLEIEAISLEIKAILSKRAKRALSLLQRKREVGFSPLGERCVAPPSSLCDRETVPFFSGEEAAPSQSEQLRWGTAGEYEPLAKENETMENETTENETMEDEIDLKMRLKIKAINLRLRTRGLPLRIFL